MTPLQELIDTLEAIGKEDHIASYFIAIDRAIELAQSLLDKERGVMNDKYREGYDAGINLLSSKTN